MMAEPNVRLGDLVSTKTVRREIHKSNIQGKAAVTKLPPTESNAQMREHWCYDHETWISDKWKRSLYGQMSRSSCCSLHQEDFTFG
jgi:hypothetical protein